MAKNDLNVLTRSKNVSGIKSGTVGSSMHKGKPCVNRDTK